MKKFYLQFVFLFSLLIACKKQEIPIAPPTPGNLILSEVDMASDYRYQVFFSLENDSIISKNLKTDWDLKFNCEANGYQIFLNSAKLMFAMPVAIENFEEVLDTVGFSSNKRYDHWNGHFDSTAIGDWRSASQVFIIDRGFDPQGRHLGFRKVIIEDVDAESYSLRFAFLDGSGEHRIRITKNRDFNFSYLSFDSQNQVFIEPPKNAWDLIFTQYTFVFLQENPPLPYLVVGVLINPHKTQSLRMVGDYFDKIDIAFAQSQSLRNNRDEIGYDWKQFTGSNFSIRSDMCFIVRNQNQLYFKLRFVDFYSPLGVKGYPTFEYKRL